MDRKTQTIITELHNIDASVKDMKSTQQSGADNTMLRSFVTVNTYDQSFTLTSGSRDTAAATFDYTNFLNDWQPSAYCLVIPQVYIDSMSTVYEGYSAGTIGIASLTYEDESTSQTVFTQLVNIDSSTHTAYIKYYIVTTALGGELIT